MFNGTSTQKGQFVLRGRKPAQSAKDGQRDNAYYLTLHDNNVTQFAVKHSSYTNATTSYQINGLLAYQYVSAFTNT